MNMNDIHQMYIELLDENELPVPDNPRYKPYLKQLILDNIPDVHFSRHPDKTKPEQILSTRSKDRLIASGVSADVLKEDLKVLLRAAKILRSRRAARRGQGGRLTTLNFRPGAVTTLNLGHVSIFYQVIFPVNKKGSIGSPPRKRRLENAAKEREKQIIVAKKQLVGLIMQAMIGAHCKNFTRSRAYVASFTRCGADSLDMTSQATSSLGFKSVSLCN